MSESLELYLLIGQSNMAGRGKWEEIDKTPHPRVSMLTAENEWVPAIEPITKDTTMFRGVGPGLAFAKIMADQKPHAHLGLITCAVGGTPLRRWERGADLYTIAVERTRIAQKNGTVAGILWHQGESDTNQEADALSYETRLVKMIHDLREDLGAPTTPFICGEIGHFLLTRVNKPVPLAAVINTALQKIPALVPHTGCISAEGLDHKGDDLHFSTAASREMGRRYAELILKLQAESIF